MHPSHSHPSGGARNDLGGEGEREQTTTPTMEGLKALLGAINTLKQDSSYQQLTSVVKEVETLRTELESTEANIKQLELGKEKDREKFAFTTRSLVDEHDKQYTKLQSHRDGLANETSALRETIQKKDDSRKELENQQAQMQAEIAKLKEDVDRSNTFGREERQKYLKLERDFETAKDETERLKADVKHRDAEIAELRESKLSLEKRHNDMRQSLQSSGQQVKRLWGLAVELKTETLATTKERLDDLWREALYMVNKHFRFKLPEASEQNVEFWKRLKEVSNRLEYVPNQSVPLPRRDSIPSRNMRCALVLARLMQLIDFGIFQPNYIIEAESGVREDLLREAMKDSRSESFRRAFLLSVSPDEQTRILDKRVTSVFNSIMWLVKGIIEADQLTALESDLQGFIKLACTVWQAIQRLQERFEPNMDYTVDDAFDWCTLQLEDYEHPDKKGVAAASSTSDEAVLVVFPRLYIVKDAEPKPLTSGIVLMKSQTLAAAQELRSEAPKSPTFARGQPDWSRNDRRRDSIIMNDSLADRNAATFLGQGAPNGQLR